MKYRAKPIPTHPVDRLPTGGQHGWWARVVLLVNVVLLAGLAPGCAPSHKYLDGSDNRDAFNLLVHCEHAQALAKAQTAAQSTDEKVRRSGLVMQILVYEDRTNLSKTPALLDSIMALPGNDQSREKLIKDTTELFDDMRSRRKADTGQLLCP